MTFILLLAALAVAGVGAGLRNRWQTVGQILMALGILGLLGVIGLQVRQNVLPSEPQASSRLDMAVSSCLANCLTEDLTGQSGRVVLIFPERRYMDEDTEKSYEEGFLPPLRHGRGALSLKAVHLEVPNGELSAFKKVLTENPDALAFVSFAGAPAGFETLAAAGQSGAPLFYIFDAERTTHWLAMLKDGRIKAVVVPQPGIDVRGHDEARGRPEALFQQFYVLARPSNADEIAATLKTHN